MSGLDAAAYAKAQAALALAQTVQSSQLLGTPATVIAASTLGATATLDLASRVATIKTYFLSATSGLVTMTNRTPGARVLLRVQQDSTGGRAFSVTDGTTTLTPPLNVAANGITLLRVEIVSATDFIVIVEGEAAGVPQLAAPTNLVAPVISGTATPGSTLSATTGTWDAYPAPTYAYQWKRGAVSIAGATSSTYLLVTADVAQAVTCLVTATNASGAASTASNTLTPALSVPVNTVAPAITGSLFTGSTLTCSTGTWTGSPAPTFARQWKRNGAAISGATAATYVQQVADEGQSVKCTVTATNASGAASADSNTVVPGPAPTPPINTVAPVVTTDGTPQTGETVSCSTGTWTGTPTITFAYQWKRAGAAISGATASTYALVSADEGTAVKCTVTATNPAGSVAADSNTINPTAGAFDPLTIVGTGAWYKLDDDVAALATSDPVPTLTDRSPNGRNLTGAGSARPLKLAAGSGINGHACPRWDGVDDVMTYLAGADWITGNTLTVFILRRINADATNAYALSLTGSAGNDYDTVASCAVGGQSAGAGNLHALRNLAVLSTASARPANGVAFVETHIFDGTNHTLRLNGTAQTPFGAQGANFTARKITLGARHLSGAPGAPFTAQDVLEILIVPGTVSAPNITAMEGYLRTRGGTP